MTADGSVDTYSYVGSSEVVTRIANSAGGTVDSIVDADGNRLGTDGGSSMNWFVPDLHGNVAALLEAADGPVGHAIRYDPWGEIVATGAASGAAPPVGQGHWKYQGRLDVSPPGVNVEPLYDMSARFYSASLGVFTQLDTVMGSAQNPLSMNRFLYAHANPATLIDPTGHGPGCDGTGKKYAGSGKPCPDTTPTYVWFLEPPKPTPGPDPGCWPNCSGPASAGKGSDAPPSSEPTSQGPLSTPGPLPSPNRQVSDPNAGADAGHLALSTCGAAAPPPWQWACDAADTLQYAAEGDAGGVVLGVIGFVPYAGDWVKGALRATKAAKRPIRTIRASELALDANVVITGLEKRQLGALDAALAGRAPVISITAAKEYLRKGDVQVLRDFLTARGGRVGAPGTAALVRELQGQAAVLGRVLRDRDAWVSASAVREGLQIATNDRKLYNFLEEVGLDPVYIRFP
ncbi:MAG TPA: RHS repeat-associated core domain-containing protein [Candidatus Limnocylindrales bacterium]